MRVVGNEHARQQVQAPAVGLLVTAILGILTHLFVVGIYIILLVEPDIFVPATVHAPSDRGDTRLGAVVCIVGGLIGLCLNGVILVGALMMKNLRSYGMAMAASIVALVPTGPCCLLGLPMAVWALVTLVKPEVKTAFQGKVTV